MTEHSPNTAFHASSFMQGHNAEYPNSFMRSTPRTPVR